MQKGSGLKPTDVMQKRTGGAASRDRANMAFNNTATGPGVFPRPQSATQKRKADATGNSAELNPGLRQLLQQNAQQNKDNQKLFQQKIGQNAMGRNVGGTTKGDSRNPANQFNLNVQNNQSRMQSQQPHRTSGNNPTAQNDYLNGLINQVQGNRAEGNGPNNHMKI